MRLIEWISKEQELLNVSYTDFFLWHSEKRRENDRKMNAIGIDCQISLTSRKVLNNLDIFLLSSREMVNPVYSDDAIPFTRPWRVCRRQISTSLATSSRLFWRCFSKDFATIIARKSTALTTHIVLARATRSCRFTPHRATLDRLLL